MTTLTVLANPIAISGMNKTASSTEMCTSAAQTATIIVTNIKLLRLNCRLPYCCAEIIFVVMLASTGPAAVDIQRIAVAEIVLHNVPRRFPHKRITSLLATDRCLRTVAGQHDG